MADYRYHNHHASLALKFKPALKFRPLQYPKALGSAHGCPQLPQAARRGCRQDRGGLGVALSLRVFLFRRFVGREAVSYTHLRAHETSAHL
eukprot:4868935-Alexandrium_andersonii.AAC.1